MASPGYNASMSNFWNGFDYTRPLQPMTAASLDALFEKAWELEEARRQEPAFCEANRAYQRALEAKLRYIQSRYRPLPDQLPAATM